jgi:hypothetical protein
MLTQKGRVDGQDISPTHDYDLSMLRHVSSMAYYDVPVAEYGIQFQMLTQKGRVDGQDISPTHECDFLMMRHRPSKAIYDLLLRE